MRRCVADRAGPTGSAARAGARTAEPASASPPPMTMTSGSSSAPTSTTRSPRSARTSFRTWAATGSPASARSNTIRASWTGLVDGLVLFALLVRRRVARASRPIADGDRPPARPVFEAARGEIGDRARGMGDPADRTPVDDDPGAQTEPERQEDDVATSDRRADAGLADGRQQVVVVDRDRKRQGDRSRVRRQIEAGQPRQVGREEHASVAMVDDPRDPGGDGPDRARADGRAEVDDEIDDIVDEGAAESIGSRTGRAILAPIAPLRSPTAARSVRPPASIPTTQADAWSSSTTRGGRPTPTASMACSRSTPSRSSRSTARATVALDRPVAWTSSARDARWRAARTSRIAMVGSGIFHPSWSEMAG